LDGVRVHPGARSGRIPGKRYEDWALDDPAGQSLETVRVVREEIEARVRGLLADLLG